MDICFQTWDYQGVEEGYVFVSEKSRSGAWSDKAFAWPQEKSKIKSWFASRRNQHSDLYWAPLVFLDKKRRREYAMDSKVLFADLDPIDPTTLSIRPSTAWESSPKRYQALWLLNEPLRPSEVEQYNKALTYSIGADRGGWDLTQVLRIPGTTNYKYEPPQPGKPLWNQERIYSKKVFADILISEEAAPPTDKTGMVQLLSKYRKVIPPKVSHLLQYPSSRIETGNRSDMLWYMESELVKAKIPMEDVARLIQLSPWNKYRGRADEWKRITTEIGKVYEKAVDEPVEEVMEVGEETQPLPWESFSDVMSGMKNYQGWLVKNIWLRRSHGIIAGEPKSFKSTLTLDLAVSVASGKPLWGKFEVEEQGPVVVIQNENAAWIMQDRMEKILNHKGLIGNVTTISPTEYDISFPPDLPIHFLNTAGFNFNDPLHRLEFEKYIGPVKPVLVIFDPLYLMFDGEVNSAKELGPILRWLMEIRFKYQTAVMVIHHWNKSGSSTRGGQRMLGSNTLHGWIESALYIQTQEADEDTDQKVIVEREFRAAGIYPKLYLEIGMGPFGEPKYDPRVVDRLSDATLLLDLLSMHPAGLSLRSLSTEMKVSRDKLKRLLDQNKDKLEIGKKIKLADAEYYEGNE